MSDASAAPRFEFATVPRILFGPGTLAGVGELTAGWGGRALVVTGKNGRRAERLLALLAEARIDAASHAVSGEPTVEAVLDGVARAREAGCEMVVGFGGGSAIDAAKAIAGLLANPGEPLDYLEVIGAGKALQRPALPWLAIPTTAGTGAEATKNAVLAVPARGLKVSMRSPHLLARAAIIDPELTLGLPPAVTATTGLDALTQLIEAYVCTKAQPCTDVLCAEGIARAARALPRVWRDPGDAEARAELSLASLWSGQALANAGLGAVHGFAAPLGGMFSAPHGAVCAALLAPAMAANIGALRARPPAGAGGSALARYGEVARWLTGDARAEAEHGVEWVRGLVAEFRIQRLSAFGVGPEHVAEVVSRARRASSMKANPVELTDEELRAVLREAL